MSYVQFSEGRVQVVYPLACGPGSPELSKSYMDMASKLFTFTSTSHRINFTPLNRPAPRADTWPTEVAAAVAACMAAAGAPRIALIGFCYGGGRVVDALGNTRTDLLESCAAPPATYSDVFASDASIDDDLLDAPPLPPRPTYTCGVAFYGTRIDLAALARVRQPLLLAFAGDDGLVPPDFIEDMRRTRARRPSGGGSRRGAPDSASADVVQIRVETGAPHGFVHQADKQGEAGDRVLAQAVLFLRKHLLHDRSVFI